MVKTKPVLVPVDFSADSEAALIWAANACAHLQAPLIVLHVIHDPESAPGYYSRADDSGHLRSMEEVAKELLAEFMERMAADRPELAGVRTILVAGLPATRILEVAEDEGAQLIVMGSRGRTGLRQLILGSKASRVVQLSRIPVTVVKATESD